MTTKTTILTMAPILFLVSSMTVFGKTPPMTITGTVTAIRHHTLTLSSDDDRFRVVVGVHTITTDRKNNSVAVASLMGHSIKVTGTVQGRSIRAQRIVDELPLLSSGIVGTVLLGPTCPVQSLQNADRCRDKPYQATIAIETIDGIKEIAQFQSSQDGIFRVRLVPGTYRLDPRSPPGSMLPRGVPQQVVVRENAYTTVTIFYDTGIR